MTNTWRLSFVGLFALGLASCDSNVVFLPEGIEAQSWLLFDEKPGAAVFNSDEAATSEFEVSRLRALPLTRQQLGLSGRVDTGEGRTIPGLMSYAFEDREWVEIEDEEVRARFDSAVCQNECLRMTPCDGCDGGAIQGCGPCEVTEPVPPVPPSKECPPQWSLQEPSPGYFECTMDRVPGDDSPCGAEQRWSIMDGGCVDFDSCSAPDLNPALLTLYVDPAAVPGGDGSSIAPFNTVPELSQADVLVLRPGSYPQLVEVTQDNLRIIGHGACTHLSGGLIVNARDVVVDGLRIESTASTLVVRVAASAVVSNTLIEGEGWVVTSSGSLRLEDSLIVASDLHSNSIRSAGHLELVGSDLRLSATADGVVSVTDTRFLLSNNDKILTTGSSVTITRSVVLGGGLRLESASAVVTDLLRDTFASRFDGLELVGPDSRVERADITARGVAIQLFGPDVTLRQVRLRSERGLLTHDMRQSLVDHVVVDGAWFQTEREAVVFTGRRLEMNDIWAWRVDDDLSVAGVILLEGGDLTLRRAFLRALRTSGVFIQDNADIEDLEYRGLRRGFVGPSRISQGEGFVRGLRWRLEAGQTGAGLPRSFDLQDIDIRPAVGMGLIPLESTLDDRSDGRVVRFHLESSPPTEPRVRVIVAESTPGWVLTFKDGSLPSTPVAIATSPGTDPKFFEHRVTYDNVRLESR